MNFLNEIGLHYPDAISFASGRPAEEFFDVDLIHRYLDSFCGYLKGELGYDDEQVRRLLFQYGRTTGIELIARQLAVDELISGWPAGQASSQLTSQQIETGLDRFASLIVCPAVAREDTPTLL